MPVRPTPTPPAPPQARPVACTACDTHGDTWTLGLCESCGVCPSCCGCGATRAPIVDGARSSGITFWGAPSPMIPLHVGVEVECGLREARGPMTAWVWAWRSGIGTDPSVGDGSRLGTARPPAGFQPVAPSTGREVRTAPAAGDAAVSLLTSLGQVLVAHRAHTDSTCGLHVHVDARGRTYDDLARLARLWTRIEGTLWNAVAPSRRRNRNLARYCAPWGDAFDRAGVFAATTTAEKETALRVAIDSDTQFGAGGRYRSLNFHSFYRHQTVEVRMHHGTVNPTKILNWAASMAQIVHFAFTHSDADVAALRGTPAEILDLVLTDPGLREWMRARRVHFAAMRSRVHPGEAPRRRVAPPAAPPVPRPDAGPREGGEV